MREFMSDEPKNLWASFVEQPRRFFLWLALATLVLMGVGFVVEFWFTGFDLSPGMRSVAVFTLVGVVGGFLVGFFGFFLALIPPFKPLFREEFGDVQVPQVHEESRDADLMEQRFVTLREGRTHNLPFRRPVPL